MRLGALLLAAALAGLPALRAQEPLRALPWQLEPAPPWQPLAGLPLPATPPGAAPVEGRFRARVEGDGVVQVWDARGVRTLRTSLPGRPVKAWRDGGIPFSLIPGSTLRFPESTPLSLGLSHLSWGSADFRPSLAGLLWVLEDGERYVSVLHPATATLLHLPLPLASGFDLDFQPDRLVLRATQGPPGLPGPRAWSLPWLALLPQLVRLGPPPEAPKTGTALAPFPK